MKLLLVGAPGSGKGTQAGLLSQQLSVEHLSSGELLRHEIEAATELGHQVEQLISRGDLVPDELVLDLMMPHIEAATDRGGWLVDGFPRTVPQAQQAYARARVHDALLDRVVHLEAEPEALLDRLLARAAEQGRADDTEQTVRHRMEVYRAQTEPLVDYYGDRGLLLTVEAEGSVETVNAAIRAGLRA